MVLGGEYSGGYKIAVPGQCRACEKTCSPVHTQRYGSLRGHSRSLLTPGRHWSWGQEEERLGVRVLVFKIYTFD